MNEKLPRCRRKFDLHLRQQKTTSLPPQIRLGSSVNEKLRRCRHKASPSLKNTSLLQKFAANSTFSPPSTKNNITAATNAPPSTKNDLAAAANSARHLRLSMKKHRCRRKGTSVNKKTTSLPRNSTRHLR
jgi:hypothetical protein